jgi:hypothetical protein
MTQNGGGVAGFVQRKTPDESTVDEGALGIYVTVWKPM